MNYDLTVLYLKLFPKALSLSLKSVGYLPRYRVSEVAHDITVDFLVFSRSFKEVYDPEKGSLSPFFSSYVRRKLRKVWDCINEEVVILNIDDDWIENSVAYTPGTERWAELKDYVYNVYRKTNGKMCCGISVSEVFRVGIREVMDSGKISVNNICRSLGTNNRKGVKKSLQLIQHYLVVEGGGENEPSFFCE